MQCTLLDYPLAHCLLRHTVSLSTASVSSFFELGDVLTSSHDQVTLTHVFNSLISTGRRVCFRDGKISSLAQGKMRNGETEYGTAFNACRQQGALHSGELVGHWWFLEKGDSTPFCSGFLKAASSAPRVEGNHTMLGLVT